MAYYWYTGTLREYATHRVGDLLVWHSLELSQQRGCRVFDFGGGGRPDEEYGVRDFKAKFGGTLVNFGRNTCVHGPLRLKVSQAGYQLMRRFL
jgi:lipid II:glycine glycyltransferase (peptidoglycan interpeptide bridge formation enzyme)